MLAQRLRDDLCRRAALGQTVTYQELAQAMALSPPQTIRQITDALEELMQQDAAAGRPMIAALVVARTRGGLPAPGFFDCARRLGRFMGDAAGPEAAAFHGAEFEQAVAFWGNSPPG